MKKLHFVLVLLISFIFIGSCSKEDKIRAVEFQSLSIAGACPGSVLKSSTEKEKTIVITSEQMLSKEIGCLTSVPNVDFKTHFVLAGRAAFSKCAELEEDAIVEVGSILKYSVHIRQNECQKMDTVYFMAALPVRYKDHPINFDISY